MTECKIVDIIQTPHAILHKFGVLVFEHLKPLIEKNVVVCLSFEGVEGMTSGFAHASVGSLYEAFGDNTNCFLTLTHINSKHWQSIITEAIIQGKKAH